VFIDEPADYGRIHALNSNTSTATFGKTFTLADHRTRMVSGGDARHGKRVRLNILKSMIARRFGNFTLWSISCPKSATSRTECCVRNPGPDSTLAFALNYKPTNSLLGIGREAVLDLKTKNIALALQSQSHCDFWTLQGVQDFCAYSL